APSSEPRAGGHAGPGEPRHRRGGARGHAPGLPQPPPDLPRPPGRLPRRRRPRRALRPQHADDRARSLRRAMPEFLAYVFMQRAFAAGALTAIICPAIGVFLVPRRLSLIADTLAHVALAGVALGLLAGVSPLLGALVVTLLGAVGIESLRARGA